VLQDSYSYRYGYTGLKTWRESKTLSIIIVLCVVNVGLLLCKAVRVLIV